MTRPAPHHALACTLAALLCASIPLGALAEPVDPPCAQTPAQPLIDLNTASAEELERLPRVGPARARAILEARERLGRFTRLSQLLRVRGIGRATLRLLRPYVTLGPAPAANSSGAARADPLR